LSLASHLDCRAAASTSKAPADRHWGRNGYSKDHRPDLRQMILAVLIDGDGWPVCSEMWPGNTADVTMAELEARRLLYILGVRERSDKLAWISTERNRVKPGLTQGIHLTRYFGGDPREGDATNIGIAKGFMRLGNLLLLVSQYGARIDNPARRHSTSQSSNYKEIVAMRSKEARRNQVIRTPFRNETWAEMAEEWVFA
jgi:hypothetical protein